MIGGGRTMKHRILDQHVLGPARPKLGSDKMTSVGPSVRVRPPPPCLSLGKSATCTTQVSLRSIGQARRVLNFDLEESTVWTPSLSCCRYFENTGLLVWFFASFFFSWEFFERAGLVCWEWVSLHGEGFLVWVTRGGEICGHPRA